MTPAYVNKACQALASTDKEFARAYKRIGAPAPRNRPAGFETFFNTIVSQQLSTHAASAIMGRARTLLPDLTPQAVLEMDVARLRDAGLSFRKIEYAQGLASAIVEGDFCLATLKKMPDAQAIDYITQLKGFGRWSAEIYLMFSLKRKDIFPADDLALRIAIGRLKGWEDKPSAGQARELVEHWAPYRTVGSLFLWHYYKGEPNQ